jgi:hypothetical protein
VSRDLGTLPKTQLHLHLAGAMRPATLRELAEGYGVPVPSDDAVLHIPPPGRLVEATSPSYALGRPRPPTVSQASDGPALQPVVCAQSSARRSTDQTKSPLDSVYAIRSSRNWSASLCLRAAYSAAASGCVRR